MDIDKVVRANETSAVQSIKKINTVESVYREAHPQKGYACALADFNWAPQGEQQPQPDQMIDDLLAYGQKSGYTFLLNCGPATRMNNVNHYSSYIIVAVPISFNHSGRRTFCSDQNGQIRFDPKGGTNCTDILQ
jgi:type IV pilus assembly protein PilA